MKLILSSEFKIMPWKNGLGSTAEIEIFPPHGRVANNSFLYRLSSATVSADGPFSEFSGCDRLLTVIHGNGLLLNGKPLLTGDIISFPGEENVDCRLIDGEVIDFGLIYRRDQIKASMKILKVDPGEMLSPELSTIYLRKLGGLGGIHGLQFGLDDVLCLEARDAVRFYGQSTWLHVQLGTKTSE